MSSGNSKKYLFYAIGEILLVVIGILIALQINNWNEFNKDRSKEKEIILGLVENFNLNVRTLERNIERLHDLNRSSEIVLSVLDNQFPFVDSLAQHFHKARLPKVELTLSQSGYEQYKNAGYDIILNKQVKKEIIDFFESTLPSWNQLYSKVNFNNLDFFDYHVPLFIYNQQSLEPLDIRRLYDDEYYLGWMRAFHQGRYSLISMETSFVQENKRMIAVLETELGVE